MLPCPVTFYLVSFANSTEMLKGKKKKKARNFRYILFQQWRDAYKPYTFTTSFLHYTEKMLHYFLIYCSKSKKTFFFKLYKGAYVSKLHLQGIKILFTKDIL